MDIVKEIIEKWSPSLKDIENPRIVKEMAIFLENQSLFNKVATHKAHQTKEGKILRLVRAMYDPANFIGWDIVNVQGMLGPRGEVTYKRHKTNENYDKDKEITEGNWPTLIVPESEGILARTRKLKTLFSEAGTELSGEEIANELNREIINDLRNNAGTVANRKCETKPEMESIYCNLIEMSGVLHRKTLASGDALSRWIVTSPKIGSLLSKDESLLDRKGVFITREGTLWSAYKLFIDPLFPDGEILMGYKDDDDPPWGAYFYCPYVPLSCVDGSCGNPLLTRYSKKLRTEGAKFYGRIEVEGLE